MGITNGTLLKQGKYWHWKYRCDGEDRWESLRVTGKGFSGQFGLVVAQDVPGTPARWLFDDIVVTTTSDEITQLGNLPLLPTPGAATTGAMSNGDLSWTAGEGALVHHVYLNDVAPSSSDPLPYVTSLVDITFAPSLSSGTTYWWRIDEQGKSYETTAGPVWTFTTP